MADKAPFFSGRLIRGVRNGPSPDWLQKRLTAIGLRPINALVDITNFFTFDLNRPLHVFDAAKVRGDLVVRPSHEGEELLALDGKTYALRAGDLVMTMGAGDVSMVGPEVLAALTARAAGRERAGWDGEGKAGGSTGADR